MGSRGLGTSAKGGQGPQERVTGRRQVAAAGPLPNHCPSVTPCRASHPGTAGGFQWLSVLSLSSGSAWRCLHPVSPDRRMHNPGTSLITWCLACLINLDNTRADGPGTTTDPHHWIASVGRLRGVELLSCGKATSNGSVDLPWFPALCLPRLVLPLTCTVPHVRNPAIADIRFGLRQDRTTSEKQAMAPRHCDPHRLGVPERSLRNTSPSNQPRIRVAV